jgi:hypothetical protein
MAVQAMAVLSLAVLFLPVFGPQLDHHFAERRPDHGHVYMGPVAPEHDHFFQDRTAHTHTHNGASAPGGEGAHGPESPQRIVYVASGDGIGQGPVDLTTRGVQQSLVSPGFDDDLLAPSLARSRTVPAPATVVPPWRPPRQ